jgi:hypothetical protein
VSGGVLWCGIVSGGVLPGGVVSGGVVSGGVGGGIRRRRIRHGLAEQRRSGGVRRLGFGRERYGLHGAGSAHTLQDELLPPRHAARLVARVRRERVRQRGGERGRLRAGQVGGRSVEIVTGRGLGAEDAGAPFGNVEVQLEDLVLRHEPLEAARDDEFLDLARRRALAAEVQVLRDLLRDRAPAANPFRFSR